MLSSVLHSERAAQVNVEIMRTFVRLRKILSSHTDLARKLALPSTCVRQADAGASHRASASQVNVGQAIANLWHLSPVVDDVASLTAPIGPFPLEIVHERVIDETADVLLGAPDHRIRRPAVDPLRKRNFRLHRPSLLPEASRGRSRRVSIVRQSDRWGGAKT
jgi:hypothetical protein